MEPIPSFNIEFSQVVNKDGIPYGIFPEKIDATQTKYMEIRGMEILEGFQKKEIKQKIKENLQELKSIWQ